MTAAPAPATPWWTTYTVDLHHGGHWQIGPSTLWIFHADHEWRLTHRQETDSLMSESAVRCPIPEAEWPDVIDADIPTEQIVRFSVLDDDPHVALQPALADRPVVARPENAIFIPSGSNATLYISTPLWVQMELGGTATHEVPTYRPSDTWFGPSTREGELCYAMRTAGRLRLADLPMRSHRAVTPLAIQNAASDQLLLERVQIPMHHLALYQAADDVLWTQAVTLHREEHTEGAQVRIQPGAPTDAAGTTRIADPREAAKKNLVMSTFKALGALFSS
jgi:hypothetical protein